MKKTLILFLSCLFMATGKTNAQDEVQVGGKIDFVACIAHKKTGSSSGNATFPRTPIQIPTVYLDNHTLLFGTVFGDDIEVQLLDPDTMDDEEPTVVYATTLTAGDDEITLPSTYTGEYGIRLVVGNWYFIGYINL